MERRFTLQDNLNLPNNDYDDFALRNRVVFHYAIRPSRAVRSFRESALKDLY